MEAAGTRVARIRREREEFHATGADLAQHVGVGAKLVVRKNLQVKTAIGLCLDGSGHFARADVQGMRVREVVGVFVGKFRLLSPGDPGRAQCAQGDRGFEQSPA